MKKPTKKQLTMHARDFGEDPKIVADYYDKGVRILILNTHGMHFCVYVGVPKDHPLAGFDYDVIPLNCRGGLTFGKEGTKRKDDIYPSGYYWYGWDYGHLGDYTHFDYSNMPKNLQRYQDERFKTDRDERYVAWDI